MGLAGWRESVSLQSLISFALLARKINGISHNKDSSDRLLGPPFPTTKI